MVTVLVLQPRKAGQTPEAELSSGKDSSLTNCLTQLSTRPLASQLWNVPLEFEGLFPKGAFLADSQTLSSYCLEKIKLCM